MEFTHVRAEDGVEVEHEVQGRGGPELITGVEENELETGDLQGDGQRLTCQRSLKIEKPLFRVPLDLPDDYPTRDSFKDVFVECSNLICIASAPYRGCDPLHA